MSIVPFALGAQTAPIQKPAFEVASIKVSDSADGPVFFDPTRGGFRAMNVTLRLLVRYAFDLHLPKDGMAQASVLFSTASGIQVTGGPAWIGSDRFYIEAKPPDGAVPSQQDLQLMMQSLLEDRFQLKAHRETRELPTYDLIVVKQGKMRLSSDKSVSSSTRTQAASPVPQLPPGALSTFGLGPGPVLTMLGRGVTMSTLIRGLETWARRPIADKTNLAGLFDVLLRFTVEESTAALLSPANGGQGVPASPTDPAGPSIFTAVEQELGLKLVSSKAPVEVLVIDSVSKPSEN
jgi:uncharacterized protein (TIGR03435 family)